MSDHQTDEWRRLYESMKAARDAMRARAERYEQYVRAERAEAALADLRERVRAELVSEDAQAVLYGVTGTHPESYGGVTKDEALECAGELLTRLRALLGVGDGRDNKEGTNE